jgi:ribosome-binding ATPase YchF (GTP1/OBG family)
MTTTPQFLTSCCLHACCPAKLTQSSSLSPPPTRLSNPLPSPPTTPHPQVPVTIKDVAGLVPGAYQGRGRGNAFLNDLCDADVLVHVVDASGSTDREGGATKEGEGADPLDEVGWVQGGGGRGWKMAA